MEKKRFKNIGKGAYISLAVCMLVIAGIGIFASVRNVSNLVAENVEELDDLSVNGEIMQNYIPQIPVIEDDIHKDDEPVQSIPEEKIPVVWREPVVGEIQKRFSDGELMYSETMNDYRTHNGIDVTAESGDAVVSVGSGMIVSTEVDPLWGMTVKVDHGDGLVSVYKNLSETLPEGIESGAYVEEGGILGAVSTSALVEIGEKPHLHLEVFCNGVPVDPLDTLSIYE